MYLQFRVTDYPEGLSKNLPTILPRHAMCSEKGEDKMRGPAPKPSTVRVVVRSTTSRVPFRSGTYSAMLEDEGTNNYAILGTTRGHDTWGQAARAALKLADRRGHLVVNRDLIERRLASGAS